MKGKGKRKTQLGEEKENMKGENKEGGMERRSDD